MPVRWHAIGHFLKAIGFWTWGLIAIGLSMTLVSANYRLASLISHNAPLESTLVVPTDRPAEQVQPALSQQRLAEVQPSGSQQRPIWNGSTISRLIAKEIGAAQQALQAKLWADAIAYLEEAEAKSPLTAFDRKTIGDFKGFAYLKLHNLRAAQQAYEAAIQTGQYSPQAATTTTRLLFRLAMSNQEYAAATAYGEELADTGKACGEDFGFLAQVNYLRKDCNNSALWADKAIAAAREAGEKPKENLFQFKLQCASDAGNNPAMAATLVELIRLTKRPIGTPYCASNANKSGTIATR
jgi:tetratricopeptide (TPR) repeat protein